MKMYLNEQQTAKLIELGFEKPKSEAKAEQAGDCAWYNPAYSIGELLSFLPPIIPQGDGYYINITHDSVEWIIDYQQHGDTLYKYIVSDVELIDAIFYMLIKLKEEGAYDTRRNLHLRGCKVSKGERV